MKLRSLIMGAVAGCLLIATAAFAATQVFPYAGVFADAVAAYPMTGTSPGAIVSKTNPLPVSTQPLNGEYELIAASDTDEPVGATGAAGDYLDHCTLMVATAAQSATVIEDGASTAVYTFATSPGGGIGTYEINVGARSVTGGWTITTGSGVTVICVGDFT